jgi:hypothetical protein
MRIFKENFKGNRFGLIDGMDRGRQRSDHMVPGLQTVSWLSNGAAYGNLTASNQFCGPASGAVRKCGGKEQIKTPARIRETDV